MSLGFYKGGPYPLLHTVVQRLYEAGVILVAAVGNYKTVVSSAAGGADQVAAGEGSEGEGSEGEGSEGEGSESVLVTVCIPPSAVAAGEGSETTTTGGEAVLVIPDPACNGQVKFPARYPETIAVGATDAYGNVAYYSITGPQVDIVAPGGTRLHSIISTTTRFSGAGTAVYGRGSGTSQATAHVTGLVVRMLEENPWLTPDEVRMILWETAKDLGVSSMAQGGGLIQVRPALTRASQWGSQ
jgi:subtilisin family serine protease